MLLFMNANYTAGIHGRGASTIHSDIYTTCSSNGTPIEWSPFTLLAIPLSSVLEPPEFAYMQAQ